MTGNRQAEPPQGIEANGEYALAINGVDVSYGVHTVVHDVTIRLRKGEKTALLGENGAGKSSLAKVITGSIIPSRGTLEVSGKPVNFDSPRSARENGIALLPQELTYAPQLSAAENICLPQMPSRLGFTSPRQIVNRASHIAASVGYKVPLSSPMNELSLMQRQIVEVLKAFGARPRVLVLDEPTAALDSDDSRRLLELVDRVAANGVSVIYISHRLDEVSEHCDSAHVLRSGRLVLSKRLAETNPSAIVEAMLGRPLDDVLVAKRSTATTAPTAGLSLNGWRLHAAPIDSGPFNLSVEPREFVALYGIRGSGTEDIARALVGLGPPAEGSLTLRGKTVAIPRHPYSARSLGISYVPPGRKTQGLFLSREITFSTSIPALKKLSHFIFRRRSLESSWAQGIVAAFGVRYRGLEQLVSELSGGNQQKVLVGSRAYDSEVAVLVAEEPTRGVDVGARHEIHKKLRDLAEDGLVTVLVTSDLEEAIILADRLVVVRDHHLVDVFQNPTPADLQPIYNIAGGLTGE